jgi:16S rRNA (cytosine1402-N4)-methyltransferase
MGAASGDPRERAHTPVLYHQVLSTLSPRAGGLYLDGTLGSGGHAEGVLQASSPSGELLGLDRDPVALKIAAKTLAPFGERVHLHRGSFAHMRRYAATQGWRAVDGVLLDLGLSSMQLADPHRGFSFQVEGPLDMRFDPTQQVTAGELVNSLSLEELTDLFQRYGEVRVARRIAREIVESRPLTSTRQLAEVILRAQPRRGGRIHPATLPFQALRIAVNDELHSLSEGLEQAVQLLRAGGRIVVISFHSLEDRIVKRTFRRESSDCICPSDQPVCTCDHQAQLRVLTKRPIRPNETEVNLNPRARSARLRAAEKLA